jgi:hypothetical protein
MSTFAFMLRAIWYWPISQGSSHRRRDEQNGNYFA